MRLALTVTCVCWITSVANGQTLNPTQQIYQFIGNSTGDNQFNAITTQPANATFSTYTRTTVLWTNAANVFNSNNWAVGGSSIDPTRYTSFTLTPNSGQFLNLESLSFDNLRTGNGPNNGEVRYSLDGFATSAAFMYSTQPANATITWNFPDIIAASPVEFRFYGYGAGNASGAMRFDNVFLNGAVSPVPEPGIILGACAVAAVAMRVGRRFRRWQFGRESVKSMR